MYRLITFQTFLKNKKQTKKEPLSYAIKSNTDPNNSLCCCSFMLRFCSLSWVFLSFVIAKWTMVLYNLNVVHVICKAYPKCRWNHGESTVRLINADGFQGTFVFFSLISSCVLYLRSSYLLWTELEVDLRQWSTLFIMTINTRTYALFWTEALQNESVHFSPARWILTASLLCLMTKVHWPTFSSFCSTYRFCCLLLL